MNDEEDIFSVEPKKRFHSERNDYDPLESDEEKDDSDSESETVTISDPPLYCMSVKCDARRNEIRDGKLVCSKCGGKQLGTEEEWEEGKAPIECHEKLVGCDEAGRGCSFSRIYVATVILPKNFKVPKGIVIKDSKQMTAPQRRKAAQWIKDNVHAWAVGWEDEKTIDDINVTQAEMKAIHHCLDSIDEPFEEIIMDGSYFLPYKNKEGEPVKHRTIPKADSRCLAVSCASILCKTARDNFIEELVEQYPELQERYDILSNLGYQAPKHKKGIDKYGITQFHRTCYSTCKGKPLNPVKKNKKTRKEE